jgi:hypothetical protein
MNGGNQLIKVTLRNPLKKSQQLSYYIQPLDNQLAKDWVRALETVIDQNLMLEKNFCFLGFPHTARTVEYLCNQLNQYVGQINDFFGGHYHIADVYTPELCIADDLGPDHAVLNTLHNHFEQLQGTVENLSAFYRSANDPTKFAIRQLNNICHELESLILSQRKLQRDPAWVRPSQITTWLNAPRYALTDRHRQGFVDNGYQRNFGTVYMHWCQIGKTYFEVWRDEHAPELTDTVCEAITHLQYYSGEFDIEWGRTVDNREQWWLEEIAPFYQWLESNGLDKNNTALSLGHLPIGQVLLKESFGTENWEEIWPMLEQHLDIYSVEVNGHKATYDYVWSDSEYNQLQIDMLRPGYKHSSRNL